MSTLAPLTLVWRNGTAGSVVATSASVALAWGINEDVYLPFSVVDPAGVAVDLTGWTLTLALSRRPGEIPVHTDTAPTIPVLANGTGTFKIAESFNKLLPPGVFYLEIGGISPSPTSDHAQLLPAMPVLVRLPVAPT